MKALLKFLLNTGAGRLIVQAIVSVIIKRARKKIDHLEGYKRDNLNTILDLVYDELLTDTGNGSFKISDHV